MAGGEVISELVVKLIADVSQFKSQMAGIGRDVNTQFTGATNDVKKGINDLNAIPISPNLKTVKNDLNDIKGVESFAPHITSANNLKGELTGTAKEAKGLNAEFKALGLGSSGLLTAVSSSSRLGAALSNNSQGAGILAQTLETLGPAIIPVAAIVGTVGLGIGVMALGSETFRKTLQGAVDVAGKLKDHLGTAFEDLKSGKINDALNEVKIGFTEVGNSLMNMKIDWRKIFGEVGTAIKSINWGEIGDAIKHGLETLGGGLLDLGGALVDALMNTDWGPVGLAIINGVGDILAGSVELGTKFREAFLKIDWGTVVNRLWTAFQDINIKIRDALINALKTADYGSIGNTILNGIKSVLGTGLKLTIDFLVGQGKAIYDFIMGTSVGKALNAIINFLTGAGKPIYDFIMGGGAGKAINALINFLVAAGKPIYDFIMGSSVGKAINALINFLVSAGKPIYDFIMGSGAGKAINAVINFIAGGVTAIWNFISGGAGKTISATISFIAGGVTAIWDFIHGGVGKAIDVGINFFLGIANAVTNFLGLGGGGGGSNAPVSKTVNVDLAKGNDPNGIFDMLSGNFHKSISMTVNLIQGVASALGAIGGAIMGGAGDLWDFVLGKSNPPDKTITVVTKESGLDQIMQTLNNMTGQEHDVNITVKCDTGPAQSAINAIAGPPPINIPIHVDTGPAQGAINAVTRASPVEIPIHVDTGPAQGAINAIARASPVEIPLHCDTGPAQSAINAIARQNAVEIPVHCDTGSAQAAINGIQGKTVDIYVVTHQSTVKTTAAAGGVFSAQSGGHMAIIGEGGEDEAVIPKRYWGGVDPGIINALPHYAAGGVIAPGAGLNSLVGPGGNMLQVPVTPQTTGDIITALTGAKTPDAANSVTGNIQGVIVQSQNIITALGITAKSIVHSLSGLSSAVGTGLSSLTSAVKTDTSTTIANDKTDTKTIDKSIKNNTASSSESIISALQTFLAGLSAGGSGGGESGGSTGVFSSLKGAVTGMTTMAQSGLSLYRNVTSGSPDMASAIGQVGSIASAGVDTLSAVVSAIAGAAQLIMPLLSSIMGSTSGTNAAVNNDTSSTVAAVDSNTTSTVNATKDSTTKIISALSSMSSGIGGMLSSVEGIFSGLFTMFGGIMSFVQDLIGYMTPQPTASSSNLNYSGSYYTTHSTNAVPVDYMSKMIGDVGTVASGGIDTLSAGINLASGAIGLISKVAGMAGGSGGSLLAMVGLQSGGIVTKPTYAHIAEHGPEAVLPLDKAGAFGRQYDIHVHVNSDVPDTTIDLITKKVTQKIQHMEFLQGGR